MQQTKIKKTPALKFIAIMAVATSVILIFTITPWNVIPTQITEDVIVIAVTEYGCVGESSFGTSVVVSDCNANVGDEISATFNVPAMKQNGFYDRIEDKLKLVNP
ncbi:MAG: hypothetical protein OEM21_02825 [Nitrosopumilus sp.]|nr:hypothetical protein [Nitrosopumilus sp.]